MNCEQCQRLILSLVDPGRPSKEVARHLAACAACRDVMRRLTRIERESAQLPVPPSTGRQAFVRGFLNPAKPILTSRPKPDRVLPFLRRWLPIAAAAALLIAVGLWLGTWGTRPDRAPDPVAKDGKQKDETTPRPEKPERKEKLPEVSLAAMVLECDLELAGTTDPVRRVEILAKLGHRLRDESHLLARASAGKELSSLSRLHARVLKEGLLPRAKILPMAERRRTLEPIATELSESHADIRTLAPRIGGETGKRLEEIAHTTELAAVALRDLMAEATP